MTLSLPELASLASSSFPPTPTLFEMHTTDTPKDSLVTCAA
jgi:hypothetical protein